MASSRKRMIYLLTLVCIPGGLGLFFYAHRHDLTPTQEVAPSVQAQSQLNGTPTGAATKIVSSASLARHTLPYNERAEMLRKKYQARGFHVVVERPFVVLGDEEEQMVVEWARNTIAWAVRKLKQDFFTRDPEKIIDVWLFKDDVSYTKCLREFFHTEPTTPFGFYSSVHSSLFMNIATGGGTLVHEMVHPFMEANFPNCPAWFNEGMGSLFEQSGEENGHIYGYPNWRLPGLQQAIKKKIVPSFKELTCMSNAQFYREERRTNYAQARYLCYYLQEKGLLVKFYNDFLSRRVQNPSGYQTLQQILAEQDMEAFQSVWNAFVLKLEFP